MGSSDHRCLKFAITDPVLNPILMRPVLQTGLALLLVAVALALLVRWFEPRFAFFPYRGETATPRAFGVDYTADTLVTDDGERLRVWLLQATNPRALVVYFHGNGGNLSMWAPILSAIALRGYSVLAIDYRGYGVSTGRPTERGIYRDAEALLTKVATLAPRPRRIIYWGRSLGATVAAYASSRQPPDGVILEAGFPDARSLLRSSPPLAFLAVFSTYRFPTATFLNPAPAPVLVMHGDSDTVVPYALGRALFERITGPKRFVTIPGGDHNDLQPADPRAYWDAVSGFVDGLPQR